MTETTQKKAAGRRAGYLVAVIVNAMLLYAINSWPGWESVPFLTDDTTRVLGWVNASVVASLVANSIYLVADPPRLKALGDLAVNGVGLYALIRIWQVFPFDFADESTVPWALIARTVLVVSIIGTIIGIIGALVRVATGRRG